MEGSPGDNEHWREWRARRDEERARRRRRVRVQRLALVAALLVALGVAGSVWALTRGGDAPPDDVSAAASGSTSTQDAPVRMPTLPAPEPDLPEAPRTTVTESASQPASTDRTRSTRTGPAAVPADPQSSGGRAAPIVWVQAGHADPREPGYRDQSGAGSGPFGNEIAFTTALADAVIERLEAEGVDARLTPGQVTPLGAEGAAFVSLHHDAPGGQAAIAGAHAGTSENYYRGEGGGDPSPTPYPDSAPHRQATTVTPDVEQASDALARAIADRYGPAFSSRGGSSFAGVVTEQANPRMTRYYGFFRTNADARVIVEAGAAGADDGFLSDIPAVAGPIATGIVEYLRQAGEL